MFEEAKAGISASERSASGHSQQHNFTIVSRADKRVFGALCGISRTDQPSDASDIPVFDLPQNAVADRGVSAQHPASSHHNCQLSRNDCSDMPCY